MQFFPRSSRPCRPRPILISFLASALALILVADRVASAQSAPAPDPFHALQFRYIGPPGNRVSAVIGVPGDNNVYYAGAVAGGIFKSTDAGANWSPVFDDQPAMSIGSLAIAPSDHSIVWAGTGETFIRSNVSIGDGIYKSTDAGKTWMHMGLDKTGRIGRILVNPQNPDVVFACALGHSYGPQPERGVFRTTDGGKHWDRVLFVDENTGCSDLSMDAHNPRVIFAGTWSLLITTYNRTSGGKGSGVYVTRDGGDTWKRVEGNGLPDPPLGKIAVAVAPSNSERVYALIETGSRGSLWRSDDGGTHWQVVNHSRLLHERPAYYTRMLVSPSNENEVYFPSNAIHSTLDGGETIDEQWWGGDNHDMWADPVNADRMMIGFDGGVMLTTNHGKGWLNVVLPNAQIYHVATDNRIPYFVYGNMQDNSSVRGPSNSLSGGGIPSSAWQSQMAGCESGFFYPDPADNNILWGSCYGGLIERYDLRTGHTRSVNPWPDESLDSPAKDAKYRCNWTPPLAISPHDHNTVYFGCQVLFRTRDGGQSWQVISPDLSTQDASRLGESGGLTSDNLGVEYGETVFAIAESPLEKGLIWAGTNDGMVWNTRDDGTHWTNVTASIPSLPPWGTISNIEPSHYDAGTAYLSVDFHQMNNRDPFIYKTTDFGKTWQSLSSDIPHSVFSFVHVVREDPFRKGLLFAGTENGLYVSFNDGAHWQPLQSELPHAPVTWVEVQPHFHDLVISTGGRGFYILDDITPLETITSDVLTALEKQAESEAKAKSNASPIKSTADIAKPSASAVLFDPRPAYRFLHAQHYTWNQPNDNASGRDPHYGATLTYSIPFSSNPQEKVKVKDKDKSKNDKDEVKLTILDPQGTVVRELDGSNDAGLHRITWDLRYEDRHEIQLRTTPPGNPHVWEEKRFKGHDWRPIYHWGTESSKQGPRVAPGTYTVRLSIGGQKIEKPLIVLKDPNSSGSQADIEASTKLLLQIRESINAVSDMTNDIEWVRKQLEDLHKMLSARKDEKSLATLKAADAYDAKLQTVEDQLFQKLLAEGDQKSYRAPMQLYMKLIWLQNEAGTGGGDVRGGADFPPTNQALAVFAILQQRLAQVKAQFDSTMGAGLAEFNQTLPTSNLKVVAKP